MSKILITGATDGIGFETAKILVSKGHHVLLHGRNAGKLASVEKELAVLGKVESCIADLSDLSAVVLLAKEVSEQHDSIDVLINNAGVLQTVNSVTADGLDVRFVVNTIAPYLLTKSLLPILKNKNGQRSRVINLSSAAQSSVDLKALAGEKTGLDAMDAYSQSKLALTMWTCAMAQELNEKGPVLVAVNPGSLLASKMVKEGFGIEGKSLQIGADILVRAALSDEFENASGQYFDNDAGQFASPHVDARDVQKNMQVLQALECIVDR